MNRATDYKIEMDPVKKIFKYLVFQHLSFSPPYANPTDSAPTQLFPCWNQRDLHSAALFYKGVVKRFPLVVVNVFRCKQNCRCPFTFSFNNLEQLTRFAEWKVIREAEGQQSILIRFNDICNGEAPQRGLGMERRHAGEQNPSRCPVDSLGLPPALSWIGSDWKVIWEKNRVCWVYNICFASNH